MSSFPLIATRVRSATAVVGSACAPADTSIHDAGSVIAAAAPMTATAAIILKPCFTTHLFAPDDYKAHATAPRGSSVGER